MDVTPRSHPLRPHPPDARHAMRLLDRLDGLPLPAAAAQIAAAGLPVFPCRIGDKRPLTGHGLLDATPDPDQVATWWQRWPAANIGLPTGAASGLVVLDIDVRTSGSGFPTFEALTRQGLTAGWAGLVFTPSGGIHAYYPAAGTARCWQAPGHHVDFRGDGGYVVIPPSLLHRPHQTAVGYRVARVADHVPRPVHADGIRDLLLPRTRATPESPAPVGRSGAPTADTARLAAWVAARGEGERNRALFWAACRLAETGASPGEIQAALGPPAAHTGLPGPEIVATIRSATRTAAPRPANPLPREIVSPIRAAPARTTDPARRASR